MNTSYHKKITTDAAYVIELSKETKIINFTTASNTSSDAGVVVNNGDNLVITRCNYLNNEYKGYDENSAIIKNPNTATYSNCSFIKNNGNFLFSNLYDLLIINIISS